MVRIRLGINMKKLVIIGASGHGKVVADIAQKLDRYSEIFFFDDNQNAKECMGFKVLGKSSEVEKYKDEAEFIVAIGNSKVREKVMNTLLDKNAEMATLVHPSAVIGMNVEIGEGTVVMAGAVINPDVIVGKGVIINTASSVDHDNKIEDYCHISVGAHLAGTVHVGKHTWIGIGASVSNNINICEECMIGAGAVVVKDIEEKGTYIGVPARKV